jgi:hypothetical protein
MKFHVFWSDVVNLSFGDRQLRKYIGRDAFRVRIQTTVADHRKNVGSFAVKVTVRVNRIMTVLIVVIVVVLVFMRRGVMGMPMTLSLHHNIKFHCADIRSNDAGCL